MIEGDNLKAILVGDSSLRPVLEYLPPGARLTAGARVVTTPDGGVFPPGVAVGRVAAGSNGPRVQLFHKRGARRLRSRLALHGAGRCRQGTPRTRSRKRQSGCRAGAPGVRAAAASRSPTRRRAACGPASADIGGAAHVRLHADRGLVDDAPSMAVACRSIAAVVAMLIAMAPSTSRGAWCLHRTSCSFRCFSGRFTDLPFCRLGRVPAGFDSRFHHRRTDRILGADLSDWPTASRCPSACSSPGAAGPACGSALRWSLLVTAVVAWILGSTYLCAWMLPGPIVLQAAVTILLSRLSPRILSVHARLC